MTPRRPRLAFWFRYGSADHAELFHALPRIIERLSAECDVHYFSPRAPKPPPESIARRATMHFMPWSVDRTSNRDKIVKTLLWLAAMPALALRCRTMGMDAVWIDETVPLTVPMALLFYGRNTAATVVDFFPEIYLGRYRALRPLVRLLRAIEVAAWRRLPLIFTRAASTRRYLVGLGLDPERVRHVCDPCDFGVYHPCDKAEARRRFGYGPRDLVLVHHGILHPNKGNDRVIRALAELRPQCPALQFLLVGDGPEMPRLRALAAELRVQDMVRFTGWLQDMSDVNLALNAADIGLVMRIGMPSDHFHSTGALVHSLACGLPVLAARLAGIADIAPEGSAALLFDPSDMEEFKAKLLRLAAEPETRRALGAQALRLAGEHFDLDKVVERTVAPLLDLVCGRAAVSRPGADGAHSNHRPGPSPAAPRP